MWRYRVISLDISKFLEYFELFIEVSNTCMQQRNARKMLKFFRYLSEKSVAKVIAFDNVFVEIMFCKTMFWHVICLLVILSWETYFFHKNKFHCFSSLKVVCFHRWKFLFVCVCVYVAYHCHTFTEADRTEGECNFLCILSYLQFKWTNFSLD